ncbi:MAG: PAS domain-containing protein [Candidatus Zixiibacteriota bacterium]|nr:MAG: PAS domain-containing protein [candidate division Zixibacteria bacterium]
MTSNQSVSSIGLTRCAVCKIDLKGRFVYLDEKIEALLGYTKEQLFGKSFLEFLDESSQHLVEQLLSHRNHYETFYDTTTITIFNRAGEAQNVRVVVSLNFIAGNPVNYQLIIDADQATTYSSAEETRSEPQVSFIKEILTLPTPWDWRQALSLLCRFTGTHQACVYLITEERLEPRSAVCGEDPGESAFGQMPDAGELHVQIARSGEEYSFLDQQAVQSVLERFGSAPNEYVTCLQTCDGNRYLVRLMYGEEFDHQKAQVSIENARLALNLVGRLSNPGESASGDSKAAGDIKFTVGFLDSLSIAAFLIDREGVVIGYNPSALRIFDERQLEGNYLDAIGCLTDYNSSELARPIVDYLNTSPDDTAIPDELTLGVKTSPSERAVLTVMRLSDEPGNLSSCFVLVPEYSLIESSSDDQADLSMWQSVLNQLFEDLQSVEDSARRLSHEFYNELREDGNAQLESLSERTAAVRSAVSDLQQCIGLINDEDSPDTTDLNLLINEQLRQLLPEGSRSDVKCEYKDLPKVKTRPRLLGQAIYRLLGNCMKYNDKPAVQIKVKASVTDDICEITIADNGFGIAAKNLPKVFDPFFRAPDRKVQAIEGSGVGLTIARRIIQALGGDISISSAMGEGSVVKIKIPVE